ncbi:MAG: hypothetical protein COA79_17025 [Planctomycetota bacterium]|nr:MAG: hypothetical protein COA79_17025 [Planctomycetota bacterium]
MKKLIVIVSLIVVVVGLAYVWDKGLLPGVPLTDKQAVFKNTWKFYEDIKYKAYENAASLHNEEDRDKANIPKLIEDLFRVPPEQVHITNVEITNVEVHSNGLNASSLTSITAKLLTINKSQTREGLLYWTKENGKWYMKLSSSLQKFK